MPDVPRPSVLDRARAPARPAPLATVDPRARILMALAFAAAVALAGRFETLAAALAAALLAAGLSGMSASAAFSRLAPLNAFLLVAALVVPLTSGETPLVRLGPLVFSEEGLFVAARIALKANALVLAVAALLGTLDANAFGHALHHLRVPEKLTHLLLFTVRYVAVLEREHRRLAAAMKLRGFRPRANRHTWRTYGHLVGMLLVRSLDRSERIIAAMKCRGFRGRFHLLDHFAFTRGDARFAAAGAALLAVLAYLEWA